MYMFMYMWKIPLANTLYLVSACLMKHQISVTYSCFSLGESFF